MKSYERLMEYAKYPTGSIEENASCPSNPKEFDFANALAEEMKSLGITDAEVDENCYVMGTIPANIEGYNGPVLGLIAHIDTAPDFSGTGVKPQLHPNYDGGDVPLGDSGRVLSPKQFPDLLSCVGQTLITTDGTTLLGADDKAGVAEILSACERLITENRSHGGVAVCFPPDEEIGHGAALLELERLGADFAYTVDGDAVEEINYETFNAAAARFEIHGVNVHPGSAKDIMVNASLLAMEINAMLPLTETPACTEGYEGYYHLTDMKGDVSFAELKYILRDHDAKRFAAREEKMREIECAMNEHYGAGTVKLTLAEQYRNMAEILKDHPEVVQRAERAIEKAGLTPVTTPIRGGTDGAQLSFRGLPCPNLGTGGAAFHGPFEHITAEHMDQAVQVLVNILCD